MGEIPWTIIVDAVVAVLLVATLIYVRRFSKQIAAIRDSRGEFEKLIGDLTRSTDRAASHLHQFKMAADATGKDLQARVDRAQGLAAEFDKIAEDLKFLVERSESMAGRLESAIAQSRGSRVSTPSTQFAQSRESPAADLAEEEDDRKVAKLGGLSGLR